MLLIQITLLIVAFLHVCLGLLVLKARRQPSAVNRAFAAQSLISAGWVLALAGVQSGRNPDWWVGLSFAFAGMIPTAFLFFSYYYPVTNTAAPLYGRIACCFSAMFVVISLGTNLLSYDATFTATGLTRKSGPLYPFFAAFFILTLSAGFGIFVRKWFSSRGLARAQFHYLGAGLLCGFLGGISTNLILPLTGQSAYGWL